MSQAKYPKAYEAYQQAVYRDGRNPTFWCSIGVLYYQINQYRDALDAYSRAIRLNPYISEVWYDLGTLVSRMCRIWGKIPNQKVKRKLNKTDTNDPSLLSMNLAITKSLMPLTHTRVLLIWIPTTSTSKRACSFSKVSLQVQARTTLRRLSPKTSTPRLTKLRELVLPQRRSGALRRLPEAPLRKPLPLQGR